MDILYIGVVIGTVLVSMTLHEAMHGFVAYFLGDDTARLQGRLTFNPIKHIDPFFTVLLPVILAIIGAPIFGGAKPVPFNPGRVRYGEWGVALVAAAGPLMNLLLAFLLFGVFVVLGSPQEGVLATIVTTGVMVNLGFFVFNSIPIPPLDGSRILYALAPDFVRRGMEMVEQFGVILIFLLVLLASAAMGAFMTAAVNFFLVVFNSIFGLT